MWEPTPYDQDPFDLGDGPPAPIWALHAPEGESEPATPPSAEAAALVEAAPENAVPPTPAARETTPEVQQQPPRTVLRRLSQLAAPIKVGPAMPAGLPPEVGRMEDALAGLERQISQPRTVAEPAGFPLPSLMERIRTARLKATEPAAQSLPPGVAPEPWKVPATALPEAPEVIVPKAVEPAVVPEPTDVPLYLAGPDDFPEAFDEAPPAPFFAETLAHPPTSLPAVFAAEALPAPVVSEVLPPADVETAPEPVPTAPSAVAVSESLAATRHLESLVAALDGEMDSAAPRPTEVQPAARPTVPAAEAGRYVVFHLGNTRYGLAIGEVLEMATVPRTTPLPNVPDFIRGVANLRGEVLAVIDLRTLLTLDAASDAVRERLLVVRAPQGDSVAGFIVDSVRGLARVGEGAVVQPSMPLNTRAADFLQGVSTHEEQLLNVLDTRKLFAAPEIAALAAS